MQTKYYRVLQHSMSFKTSIKRERSRSASSDSDSYERSFRSKMDRPRHSNSRGGSNSKKVYVSNINFDCSHTDLKDKFSTVGEVTYVQMIKEDKRFRGCAVITFKEPDSARDAIEHLNRQEFKGRKLVVKEEDAMPDHKSSDRKRQRDDYDIRPCPLVAPSANYNMYGLSMTFLESLKIDLPLVDTVFVANLDYDVEEKHLQEIFSLAGNIIDCEIFKSKDGKSRGFGIVEFEHPVEAVQAISMLHNQTYRDRLLTVRMDRSDRKKDNKPKLPAGLKSVGLGLGIDGMPLRDVRSLPAANLTSPAPLTQIPPLNPMPMNDVAPLGLGQGGGLLNRLPLAGRIGGGLAGSGLGLGRDFGQSTYTPGSLGNIIQITNLPLDFTSDSLRKLCWTYGDVRLAEMRSQGAGMVKFRSEADAQRAVDMLDRQPLDGRLLNATVL